MHNKLLSAGLTRRKALKAGMGAIVGTTLSYTGFSASSLEAPAPSQIVWDNPYRNIRGFNYQPGYGATGYDIWSRYQPEKFDRELGLGKLYFPGINTVRYWLSFDAFSVDPKKFSESFESALAIADRHGLKVIPTLFNNWHSVPAFGGIADEMLRYWFVNYGNRGEAANYVFRPYFEKIVGEHSKDERILIWDLCNEPHNGGDLKLIIEFLTHTYHYCKKSGATQPVSVSVQGGLNQFRDVEAISDLYLIHPYFAKSESLNEMVVHAKKNKKGILAAECCWGSLDDSERAKMVESDCSKLALAGIGFMPHALHESYVGDLHRAQFGALSSASSMHFIEMDGGLRAGHDVFNKF